MHFLLLMCLQHDAPTSLSLLLSLVSLFWLGYMGITLGSPGQSSRILPPVCVHPWHRRTLFSPGNPHYSLRAGACQVSFVSWYSRPPSHPASPHFPLQTAQTYPSCQAITFVVQSQNSVFFTRREMKIYHQCFLLWETTCVKLKSLEIIFFISGTTSRSSSHLWFSKKNPMPECLKPALFLKASRGWIHWLPPDVKWNNHDVL